MKKRLRSWLIFGLVAVAVLAFGIARIRPSAIPVETSVVSRGSLSTTVEERGRTRAARRYSVAAPVSGRLLRTEVHVGQRVEQGETLARIAPPPDDRRTAATARAELAAAQARQRETEALLQEARGTLARARSESTRRTELYGKGLISIETRDQYAQNADAARARLASVEASVAAATAQVQSARSRLPGTDDESDQGGMIDVVAPVAGEVLSIFEESERVVPAGTALFELAAGDSLELVVDVLTQDAVSIARDAEIRVSGWGGSQVLSGRVKYVEPRAFTKVSTLGVEEQRVNVIGEMIDPPHALGAEYRVSASIVTWQDDDVLLIPTSAVFRREGDWYTFVASDGTARLRGISVGRRGAEHAELLTGTLEGDEVILFPSDSVQDGVRISRID